MTVMTFAQKNQYWKQESLLTKYLILAIMLFFKKLIDNFYDKGLRGKTCDHILFIIHQFLFDWIF